ncbi:MAG: TonB-dependent receptor [bacterium]
MHVSRRFISFFNRALVLAFATSALTAVSAPVTTNAPIVVTASRANRTVEEMPANVTVITADAIRESGAQNVVSALETLGGVYFRRSSDNPAQADVSMRGFGETSYGRVLVLVDGQRLNGADMATLDWLRVPVSAVDRIEVLHGSQTALYGDLAVAGVINIITHQPSDQPATTLSATVGSDNTLAGHIGHTGSVGDARYTGDLDWQRSDGWRDNSDYENADIRATVSHAWTDRFRTDLAAFDTGNTYGMPGFLYRSQLAQNPRQTLTASNEVSTHTFGGSLGFDGLTGADDRWQGMFAASQRSVQSDYISLPSYSDSTLTTYTFTPRYTCDTDVDGHRNSLLFGVDLGLNALQIQSYTNRTRTYQTTDATLRRSNAGVYAQDTFWLTDKLALTLGARGEIYHYRSEVANVFDDTSTTYDRVYRQSALDAALLYRPTDQVRLFARASTLYHDPFLDELTGAYGFVSSYGATPPSGMNLDLKPELGHQYEIGASVNMFREWTAALSLYRLDMRDEIAYNPQTWANGNLPQTCRYGADTFLTWQRQNVGLISVAYNYVAASLTAGDYNDKQIPLVPAHVVTVHGELSLPLDLSALATLRGVSAQYLGEDYGHQSPRLPTYATLDLGLRYTPRQVQGLEIVVGADNVFDKIYANSGYDYGAPYFPFDVYYPAPGRTWKVTATYRF